MPELALQSPGWLLLLPLVAGLLVFELRRGRRRAGAVLRGLLLLLLGLGISRPVLRLPARDPVTVHVLDVSDSIPEAERQRALAHLQADRADRDDQAQLVLVGASARALPLPLDRDLDRISGEATDLAAGLSLARALVPPGAEGRLVIYTDGHAEDLDPALSRLDEAGLAREVVPLDPARPAPALADLRLPAVPLSPGATLFAEVALHGGPSGFAGELLLELGEDEILRRPVEVGAREMHTLSLEVPLPEELEPGLALLTARIPGDAIRGGIRVRRPPRAWIVGERRDGQALQAALEAESFSVRLLSPAELPPAEALSGVDLVVLAGPPAAPGPGRSPALPRAFQEALPAYVRSGGGLIATGGEQAYDQGDWDQGPLAGLLPVIMEPKGAEEEANLTLVIALDKSGSMAQPVEEASGEGLATAIGARLRGGRPEGSKIQLVNRATVAAIEKLRPEDFIGVLAVDTKPTWVVPLQSAARRVGAMEKVLAIGAGGGGIYVSSTLNAAFEALSQSETRLRHLILFADTSDAVEQADAETGERAEAMVARMAKEADITLSVIGIGQETDRDTAFLRSLAEAGGGRFLRTDDIRTLKSLFLQETEQVLGQGLDEDQPFRPRIEDPHPALQGIDFSRAPPLRGHNAVKRRPRTRVLLESPDGAPILATTRLGMGQVAAWTSDVGGRWAGAWLGWPGHARLWTQLSRSLARSPESAQGPQIEVEGRQIRLSSRGPDDLSVRIPGMRLLIEQDGESTEIPLDLVEPGLWRAPLPAGEGEVYRLVLQDGDGMVLAQREGVGPPSPERLPSAPDDAVLARLSSPGKPSGPGERPLVLWPWLFGLAALLLPMDAFLRR